MYEIQSKRKDDEIKTLSRLHEEIKLELDTERQAAGQVMVIFKCYIIQ